MELKDTFDVLKKGYNYKSKKLEICLEGNKKDIEVEDFRHMYRLVQELLKIAVINNDNNNEEQNELKTDNLNNMIGKKVKID